MRTPPSLPLRTAFADDSALFKHEVAYVLGQMKNRRAIPPLEQVLSNEREEDMVRHEVCVGVWVGACVCVCDS